MAPVNVPVNTTFNPSGTTQAQQAFTKVAQQASKADKAILASAQAQAKLEQAGGAAAKAEQTLSAALAQVDRSSLQAIRTQTQLLNIQHRLSNEKGPVALPRTLDGLSGSALKAATAITGIGSALAAVSAAANLAQLGAQADLVRVRFDSLAQSAGMTGDALLKALRAGSAGEISDLNLQLAANKAQLLDVAHSAEQFGVLMSIARDRAQQMGISTTQAFDDLTTGLGRGSRLILDNLGIIVNADAANEAYAQSIGKTAAALTDAERKQALINQVLKDGAATMAATGGAVESAAGQQARFAASLENTKARLGSLIADLAGPYVEAASNLLNATEGTKTGFDNATLGAMQFAGQIGLLPPQLAQLTDQAQQSAAAAVQQAAATQQATTAIQAHTVAATGDADAGIGMANAWKTATMQSVLDAAAKTEQEAKTALLTATTNQAVDAFLALHPNISASGIAALTAAGQISPLIAQLATARVRALEAANALIAFNNAANAKSVSATVAANRAAGRIGRGDSSDAAEGAAAAKARAVAAQAAQREQTLATGTTQKKIALLQKEYDAQVQAYGKGSAEAIRAQTALLQAQEAGTSKRVGAAAAGGTKLANIEMQTGNKIEDLAEKTADKLAEIDKRAAEERAAAYRKLQADIATSAADMRAKMEVNDLDLIGVSDPDAAARLNDRERAEADARKRSEEAAEEARARAEAGEAETAANIYDVRQQQISDQQALDEKYYQRQRELAEDPAALEALRIQYEEGTRAIAEAAQVRIDLANAEAAQKAAAVEAEKAAVIAAADEQAAKVTSRAQQSAAAVKAASADARAKAVADLKAIGDAVNAIPSQKNINVTTTQTSTKSGTTAAAGGGQFMTTGPTTLKVGDNPGGREMVTVTPLSGVGRTRVGSNMIAMAGGGTVIDAGDGYTTPIAGADAAKPGKGKKGKAAQTIQSVKDAIEEQRAIISLLSDMVQLRHDLEEELRNGQPFNVEAVQWLAKRAALFTQMVRTTLIPVTKEDGEALKRYLDAARGSISVLSDMGQLRHDLQDAAKEQPFDMAVINGLVIRAKQFTEQVRGALVPTTEIQAEQVSRYADAVGSTVGILSDVAGLRKDLQEVHPALDLAYATALADEAMRVTTILLARIIPTTEEQVEGLGHYADVTSSAVSIVSDIAVLREDMAEPSVPLDEAQIIKLADEAARVTKIVGQRLVPTSEEQAKQMGLYADAVGSGASALSSVLDLSGKLFTDYVSPSDQQINMLATDAQRVVRGVVAAASTYSKEGLEAGKLYAEGVGATFSAFKDGLLFFDALKSGDFQLDTGALAKFEGATVETLGVARRLGQIASTIPAGDIAALQSTTAALAAQSEALIRLAAVPFGDLPGAALNLQAQAGALLGGARGSGGGPVTVYVNVYQQPGQSAQALAGEVARQIGQAVQGRR